MSNVDIATKRKLLDAAINKLKKSHGDDVILNTEEKPVFKIIPSGSLLFDQATGIGGIPLGKIIEIFGENSVGKSSWAYSLCSQAQKTYPDRMVLYVDTEHSVVLDYMEQFGVDLSKDKLLFVAPDSIEQALDIMETMINTGLFSLVILDSVGASLSEDQIKKGIDENTMGSVAKRMSVGSNKIKNAASKAETAVVFINQVYSSMAMYGPQTTTKGGKALPYACAMRVQLNKRDLINSEEDKEKITGQALSFKFVKNKLGQPYVSGETVLYFGKGFDQIYEMVDLAIEFSIIRKGGAWFNLEVPEKKGSKKMVPMKFQGKNAVLEFFRNDQDSFEYIKNLVLQKFHSKIEPVKDEDGYGEDSEE